MPGCSIFAHYANFFPSFPITMTVLISSELAGLATGTTWHNQKGAWDDIPTTRGALSA